MPLAIYVEVAGRKMQEDFEPILERQIHHLINYAQGTMHIGQRDIAWVRIAKQAVEKGFELKHIGSILHAKFHQDFGNILDKVQVTIYTEQDKVEEITAKARGIYKTRDERVEGMTDEGTETYYSCTLCQSFAPDPRLHDQPGAYGPVRRLQLAGLQGLLRDQPHRARTSPSRRASAWTSGSAASKESTTSSRQASRQKIEGYNLYSIMEEPMTTCGCCECIAAVLPMCNGIMTVDRDFKGETPCGMKFTTLAGTIGGGVSSPGFVGHSKYYITQRKFIKADGGSPPDDLDAQAPERRARGSAQEGCRRAGRSGLPGQDRGRDHRHHGRRDSPMARGKGASGADDGSDYVSGQEAKKSTCESGECFNRTGRR